MKLSVIGSGYVGLVSAICFADVGHHVICVDNDAGKIEKLQRGEPTIYEQGLDFLFSRVQREGRLHFATTLQEAIEGADLHFLCLPTPEGENGEADLTHVLTVSEQLGTRLAQSGDERFHLIVAKSTVPVGTCERIRETIRKKAPRLDFDVASNPEFLREGFAVEDFQRPSRVVIGSRNSRAIERLKELYAPFMRTGNPIYVMDERSSELAKYAANSYLATRLSFINEIATLCEATGANVDDVRLAVGADPRIGKQFLFPGLGYGGACLPKDVRALIRTSQEFNSPLTLLAAANAANRNQRQRFCDKIERHFQGNFAGRRLALWGLAFKANTDDVRESPALDLIEFLLRGGATLVGYDPEAMETARRRLGDRITYAPSAHEAVMNADALVIATEWNEFRQPDLNFLKSRMKSPVIFDGRNLLNPTQLSHLGFTYVSVGRPHVN